MSIEVNVRGNLGSNIIYKTITRKDNEVGEVVNFSIASTDYQRKTVDGEEMLVSSEHTEWLECEYWNRNAQQVAQILKKGMPVTVVGREIVSFYEKDGQQVKTRRLRVERLYLNLDSSRIESVTLKPARNEAAAESDDNAPPPF